MTGGVVNQALKVEPPRPAGMNYHPLVIVLAAACLGIVADRFLPMPAPVWWSAAIVCWVVWAVLWRRHWRVTSSSMLLLSVAGGFGAWHHVQWWMFPANDLASFVREDSQPVAVRAIAVTAPKRIPAPPLNPMRAIPTGDRSQLEVRVTAIRDKRLWRPAAGLAMLSVDGHLLGVHAGDQLEVFATCSRTSPPGNPGEMDFAAHARADRRRCVMRANYPDCVRVIAKGSRWNLENALQELRTRGDRLLWSHLNHERSGLAAALLLGAREQLETSRMEAFFQTNTIHFLAISGLHVGILAGALFYGLRLGLFPRKAALVTVAIATILYALLTDSQPSAVRATILVVMICVAMCARRPTLPFNCLAGAALFILVCNPADLFRTGPQLSFLAVGTLCWFGPQWLRWQDEDALERLVAQTRPAPLRLARWIMRWFWRATMITAMVWLTTLPLIMNRFHLMAPAAIVLSTLLSIPIAVALLSGFGVLTLGWLAPPLGSVCGWICDGALWAIDGMVTVAAKAPGARFWVAGPDVWWVAVFYAGLLLWAALPAWRPRRLWSGLALAAWCAIGLFGTLTPANPAGRLRCTFLSVGNGCATLLELPDGRRVLYDAGRLGSPSGASRSVAGFLWSRGIWRLDAVVISHADVDHYNGLPRVFDQFTVDAVYVSPVMFSEPSPALDELKAILVAGNIPLRYSWEDHHLPEGADYTIKTLHPPYDGVLGNDNANSLVLAVEFQGKRILLTGDLEGAGLNRLLASPAYDCDVLLAPHHGSARSNPPGFAAWGHPEWVVISGGFDRGGVEVSKPYQDQGARVLHTAWQGAVTVIIENGQLDVSWHR